jgi:hypothetical protein
MPAAEQHEDEGAPMTPAAAARCLGISRKSVGEAIKAGRLKARHVAPRVWLIEPADLEAYRQRASGRKRRGEPGESAPGPEEGSTEERGAAVRLATAPEQAAGQAGARCRECGAIVPREAMRGRRCARCQEDLRAASAELAESVRKVRESLPHLRAERPKRR